MLVRPVGEGEQKTVTSFYVSTFFRAKKGKSLHFVFIRNRRVTLVYVTFYELAGEGARVKLGALARALQQAGTTTELLENTTQPGLFLLICRSESAPSTALPEGTKVWQFRQVG